MTTSPNRNDNAPSVSVVIASFSGESMLSQCLDSILTQPGISQIIAATSADEKTVARLAKQFSTVTFIRGTAGASVFALRTLGAKEATGQVVVLTEDHCTFAPNWSTAIIQAWLDGHRIIGGPVDKGASRGAYLWALYFVEYGYYTSPQPDGAVPVVSGINVAYDHELLNTCRETWAVRFRENEVHEVLCRRGESLYMANDAKVQSYLGMSFGVAMKHLLGGGRHYGFYRRKQSPMVKRVALVLASPLVFFVLLARIARRAVKSDMAMAPQLIYCGPFLACLLCAWSLGEAIGYIGPKPSKIESAEKLS